MKAASSKALPKVVSRTEWKRARANLITKEKAETRRRDAHDSPRDNDE